MREWVLGYALGVRDVAESQNCLEMVRDDLYTVYSVIESSEELGSVLSDSTYSPQQRSELVTDIFGSKVTSSFTTNLLEEAVSAEIPSELRHTLKDLPEIFFAEFNPDKIGFASTRKRVEGYTLAQVRVGGSIDLADVENDLFKVARTLEINGSLRRLLSGVGSNADLRKGLVSDLFSERISAATLRLILFAVQTSRVRDIVELLDDLVVLLSSERGKGIADVRSARELLDPQKEMLLSTLEGLMSRSLELRDRVQPNLVAGIVALVGDTLFDISARRRLEEVRSLVADAIH